jgi:hypothetical protein
VNRLSVLELMQLCCCAAVVGFALYEFGYHIGRSGARLVQVPVDELGGPLFVQAPAAA